ncbi:hypothetical protein NXS98_04995 [Fontisphaera persica]|uniref:hypothetical protein n=1 Tax=Fontisphaera persica TaxID=2974023 RepID=UPI0024C06E33|nr:hypothetical protein [Fontisphaera persica]WCJ60492.1 hypothetical protein NXS98_04995 [Fontisphaera persica]
MISPQKYQMVQRILLLGGLFLALFYFLVFVPLCERVNALESPLGHAWANLLRTRLVDADQGNLNTTPLDLRLRELELAAARLGTLSNTLAIRLSFNSQVEAKMRRSFQLVDFQNERQLRQEELLSAAAVAGVTVAPAVWNGYPEYSADMAKPELLWGHLTVAHETALLAVRCGITNLISLNVRPPRAVSPAPSETAKPLGYELPVTLNLTGSWSAVLRFLACLPVRHGDPLPAGLPELPPGKPVFYLERIMLRKDVPENVQSVRLEIRLLGVSWAPGL